MQALDQAEAEEVIGDGRISNRRIAFIVVVRIENRYRQKHLTVRPGISKPAERTMDTRRMLRMYAKGS